MVGEDNSYYQGERRRNKSRKSMKQNKSGKNTAGDANNESFKSQKGAGYQEGSETHTSFLRENPQRIDTASANKRISFTYEQCLMYLYHYPDIWFDYATWHAKSGSVDSAIKVYQRSLKALPDCAMLRYAYAELEESRGAIQAAKKVYESLLGDGVNATALSHIQFIWILRRTEGVEAARKYFLDARKSPNCTYHVYVAYATMSFGMDKDAKVAHNVFEIWLKRFMHEPGYILE